MSMLDFLKRSIREFRQKALAWRERHIMFYKFLDFKHGLQGASDPDAVSAYGQMCLISVCGDKERQASMIREVVREMENDPAAAVMRLANAHRRGLENIKMEMRYSRE